MKCGLEVPVWKDAESKWVFQGHDLAASTKSGVCGIWCFQDCSMVYDAFAHFNMGKNATTKILEAMGLNAGAQSEASVIQGD